VSEIGPLTGYTIGITAARRREELGMALERRGAKIVYAPAIRIVPLADDTDMLAATRRCLAAPPDIVVVTTGIGFRGWMEAAEASASRTTFPYLSAPDVPTATCAPDPWTDASVEESQLV